ncbi:uncharacterized protein CELE_ZK673.5 [Caenorhabditis elegans]|uniref:Uncharacterized protein ZK673.5 n=1 Tax=Caenorhabditis elegans TaxID=6239 RepID=YS55_CAEEL|nr:Uncharacterized protein CELE_ZK673.5 [Caenorhabditis elegans]Q09664.2 RecName: Full=Uncharacterized protein ZK673.5 [Caenorhabditis elegans]CAA88483.1 Uncharacterized protein CELE_ZK673.5 [Caenorhabditis elegans]|eukprot:NP_496248.1 Uncharacterized protein CELE_ZK673.5 [Caenorhabditis elegans]
MEYSYIPSAALYNNADIFQFFPRNKRLNSHQKSRLDEHARKMAAFMMERQEEYRYYENLANQEQFSDDNGMESGFCSGATSTGQSASTSPAPVQLIPNPFFDPEYVAAKTQSPVKLVTNPFFNPELVEEIKKKSQKRNEKSAPVSA